MKIEPHRVVSFDACHSFPAGGLTAAGLLFVLSFVPSIAGAEPPAVGAADAGVPFEAVYGESASTETMLPDTGWFSVGAGRGLTAVHACRGGGFVIAGTTLPPGGGASDVYVVRTGAHGQVLWERGYDRGGLGAADLAVAVVELRADPFQPGFAVAGTTRADGNDDVFVLRLDCQGAVRWTRTYGSPAGLAESAADLLETRHGPNLRRRGDLVVAGAFADPGGAQRAGLLRVGRDGLPLWSRRYDRAVAFDRFSAVTEARNGDLVAVGLTAFDLFPPPIQGYVVRVDGRDGGFHAPAHCAASYGGGLDVTVTFRAAIELVTPPHAGELVFAGHQFFKPDNVIAVRTAPDPCTLLAGSSFGDGPAQPPFTWEEAEDVREVLQPPGSMVAGQLVLVGSQRSLTGASQAFLALLDPHTLELVPGSGRLYGEDGHETAGAVVPYAGGFVLAGSTTSDPQGVGDPGDLYLLRTDAAGHTACSGTWWPLNLEQVFEPRVVSPTAAGAALAARARRTRATPHQTGFRSCE